MSTHTPEATAALIRAIAGYLRSNPLASDTPEGISRWWLDDDTVPIAQVKTALDWMVARGLLGVLAAADGRLRYRRIASATALEAEVGGFDDDAGATGPVQAMKAVVKSRGRVAFVAARGDELEAPHRRSWRRTRPARSRARRGG
jgi:hypothetical protein